MHNDPSSNETNENRRRRNADVQAVIREGLSPEVEDETGNQRPITETSQTDQGGRPDTSQTTPETTVKQRKHFSMYVGANLVEEVNALYDHLNEMHKNRFGVKLPKNKRFYPLLLRYGIDHSDEIQSELHLD